MPDRVRLGVVMDPIDHIKPAKDTTLAMMLAAQRRGWQLHYLEQRHIWLRDGVAQGRAHPMIDPGLRLEELARVGSDPATGVVLIDVVLGHGAEPDPAAGLGPVLSRLDVPVIASVVGTRLDPQDRARQVAALVEAGVEVHLSNARATRRALELLGGTR